MHTIYQGLLALAVGLTLAACGDSVPLEEKDPPATDRVLSYKGDPCGYGITDEATQQDACTFKVEFWNPMSGEQCVNCHGGGDTSKGTDFLDQEDVNAAYYVARSVVDLTNPDQSTIISQINEGHNCGNPGACAALASVVQTYITNWANGGATGGGGSGTGEDPNDIELKAPVNKDPGTSKTMPTTVSADFQPVHDLLTQYCSNCHREAANTPQSPFFADSDIAASYEAVRTSQKIDLENPFNSRLVQRLIEGHNCWDTNVSSVVADKYVCATEMRTAIETFAGTIPVSTVDSNWVTSKALTLDDGIVASGGTRDDSSAIALYQFKTGNGDVAFDTSGVSPALDLQLYGTEGIGYKWVGGWGIDFIDGRAQGSSAASSKIRDHIVASGEYSIEAWVIPNNVNQGSANNPRRIISYSGGSMERNFTLGQAEYRYAFGNTNSNTGANGDTLLTDDQDEDVQATQQHVVITYHPTNGRTIYVNGEDTGDTDTSTLPGNLGVWDGTFPLIFGSEAGGAYNWQGKLRLVAIHDRALTPEQVKSNFDAGVGEKFFLLFSVSDHLSDANCMVAGEPQCFIMFTVSQFDEYSYLFDTPTFVALNDNVTLGGGIQIKGLRLGINGKEPATGQAYRNLDVSLAGADLDANGQKVLSDLGTIIALEKGTGADEFFLTFQILENQMDASTSPRPEEYVCGVDTNCTKTAVDGEEVSHVGLRTFEEILASMGSMTGVDPYAPQFAAVMATYYDENPTTGEIKGVKQQMPNVENIKGFVSANQMGIAQLAIQFCDAMVEDATLRSNFFGSFGFTSDVATAFGSGDSAEKNQIVNALYDKMVGYPDADSITLADMPARADVKAELIGPAATNANNLFDRLTTSCPTGCDQVRTRAIVKAMCTAVLGSATMLLQ
jgi:hypothetical protein